MIIKRTKFKGLLVVKQENNTDARGNLRETFNDKILKKNFVFEYCFPKVQFLSKIHTFDSQLNRFIPDFKTSAIFTGAFFIN